MNKKIIASASLFHAVNDGCSVAVPMIFPLLYSQRFIITQYSHIGILANLGFLSTLVFQVLVVSHAHQVEYKHTVLISLSGIALFLLLLTRAESFFVWLALYLVLRAFMSFYHPIGIAVVSRTHPDKGLDFAMGFQSGSGNLGVFIAFMSAGYMAQQFGWRVPLYAWAAAALAVGILSHALVRSSDSLHRGLVKPDFGTWIATASTLKRLLPGFIFGGACWGTTVYYAPSLFNHRFLAPLGETGVYLALWIALGAVMPYLFGYLSGRFGRARMALLGLTGSSVAVGLLGLSRHKGIAVASLLVYGGFLFLIYPAFQSFVGTRAPSQDQAVAFSLAANVQMLSGAVIILLSGFISDRFGINAPFLVLAGLGFLVSTYYFLRSPAQHT